MPRTLVEELGARVLQEPQRVALVGGGVNRTWSEFEARTNGVVVALRRFGLRRKDRVAILATSSIEWVEAFVGILKAGGVAAPLNTLLTPAENAALLDHVKPNAMIVSPELSGSTNFRGPVLSLGSVQEGPIAAGQAQDLPREDLDPEDLAVIASTSGTTGLPKCVMWSHRALRESAQCTPFPAEVAGGARILMCAPLFTAGAIVMVCNALAIGATMTIARFEPAEILRILVDERIEFIGLAPTMIALLLNAVPADWQAPALRRIFYGAGPMKPELLLRAQRLFGCEFQQAYGMSETCTFGTRLDPADHRPEAPERITSAGKAMAGVRLKIVDEEGTEVAPGVPGEILMTTPGDMLGYWMQPEETSRALAGGWLHTGDIGRLDAEGYLYVLDRKDDMVKSGGLSVSPVEVEGVLLRHPGVEEAVVIGVPDAHWGQRVTAIVRRRSAEAVTENELIAHCRSQLAPYKVPRAIVFSDSPFPRNALGKVSRPAIRARYQAGEGR